MSYEGDKVKGERHGMGTYTYTNKYFSYTGHWVNGEKHGEGKLIMADGVEIEADFLHGEITGRGTKRWPNGSKYEGEFLNGEFEGKGVYYDVTGDVYKGDWHANRRHGLGELRSSTLGLYTGGFHLHKFQGKGVLESPTGDVYAGSWIAGKRHGLGKARFAAVNITYEGLWEDDRQSVSAEFAIAKLGDLSAPPIDGSSFPLNFDVDVQSITLVLRRSLPKSAEELELLHRYEEAKAAVLLQRQKAVDDDSAALAAKKKVPKRSKTIEDEYSLPSPPAVASCDVDVTEESGRVFKLVVVPRVKSAAVPMPSTGEATGISSESAPSLMLLARGSESLAEESKSSGAGPSPPTADAALVGKREVVSTVESGVAKFEVFRVMTMPGVSAGDYNIVIEDLTPRGSTAGDFKLMPTITIPITLGAKI